MRRSAFAIALAALASGGCSGGGEDNAEPAQPPSEVRGATTTDDPTGELEEAVRDAVRLNARMSDYVLRHNKVPASARDSTRGPALAALRQSVAERRRQHISARGEQVDLEVLSVQLDPSYTRATAIVHQRGRVRPYRDGRSLGRAIKVDDKVRLQLRRVGNGERFVVWKVGPAR